MAKPLWNRRTSFVLIVTASLALLSGCTSQASADVTAFDRAQIDTDLLPAGPDVGVAQGSSRLLFENANAQYFAAESTVDGEVCLAIYVSDGAWVQSCATALPVTLQVDGGGEAQLNAESADFPSSDEWDQVAANLALRK